MYKKSQMPEIRSQQVIEAFVHLPFQNPQWLLKSLRLACRESWYHDSLQAEGIDLFRYIKIQLGREA